MPVEKVFPFFADEKNLERITPPWLSFRVLSKTTAALEEGTRIRYQLKVKGIPIRWQSQIESWTPNAAFVDRQLNGPYKVWHHTHSFTPLNNGTLMTDTVRYRLPGGSLGAMLAGRWVRNDLRQIFEYRRDTIEKIFR